MQNRIAKTLQLLVVICITTPALSQNILKGKVIDSSENKKLHNSIVALIDLSDTTLYRSWRAGTDGGFSISKIPAGKYTLMISYPRMADFLQELDITDTSNIDLGNIAMITEAKLMQEVVVTAGRAIRMRGDTLEFTADSFAVRPGANVQALLKRLPGIEVSRNGAITAQGQEVKKLLVDGDEFFTDDPKFASQYLRANAIDKVQVFDKRSEESVLTGFDDGRKIKTINLKMKGSAKNGYFGKASAGGNGDGNYEHELMLGAFKGPLKAGVFGIASKSMSRDFSGDVLSRAGGESVDYVEDGAGMLVASKSQSESIGQYSGAGLPSILNGGAHFSNKWNNNKNELLGNYRLRSHTGEGWSNTTRFTKLGDSTSFLDENAVSDRSEGFGHNLSGKVAMKLDTFTQVQVKIAGSKGRKDTERNNRSSSVNFRNIMVNNSATEENEITNDQSLKSSVSIYRDMPKLAGKLNVTFEQEYSDTRTDNHLLTTNNFFNELTGDPDRTQELDRLQASTENYEGYGGRVSFTNRIRGKYATQLEYGIKTRMSESRFNTLNGINGKYDQRVDSLSNNFDFTSVTQIAGAGITLNTKKWNGGVGTKAFVTGLKQVNLDANETRRRSFTNIAPYLRLSYNFGVANSLQFSYSGVTTQPSMEQLQPVRRSNNELIVQDGNPDLVPGFNNNASLSYNRFNLKKEIMLTASVSGTLNSNVITNATNIDEQNRRVSKFMNVDGLPGFNASVHLGKGWRSKGVNISGGLNYSSGGNYNIQNGQQFKMFNTSYGVNTMLRYEHKETFNASLSSHLNFSNGRSELPGAVNSKNFTHNHSLQTSVVLPWKLEIGTDLMGSFNPGNNSFASSVNVITWNANIQKKFLQSEKLVLKATVNDILNRNTGYNRSIDGANWTEMNGFVLRRYFMVSLTWNFLGTL